MLLSYEVFSHNFEPAQVISAKQQIYLKTLVPHIPNGKSIVGFAGLTGSSQIDVTFGTNAAFGQYTVRAYNPQDSAIGITQLKCVLFYA